MVAVQEEAEAGMESAVARAGRRVPTMAAAVAVNLGVGAVAAAGAEREG